MQLQQNKATESTFILKIEVEVCSKVSFLMNSMLLEKYAQMQKTGLFTE
jgi:hypothetical protein